MEWIWIRTWGVEETLLLVVFAGLYALFVWRTYRSATVLHTQAHRVWIKASLRTAYFILMLLALLGPSFGKIEREVESVGKDIYIALDLSGSMNARDIPPSRLEKVKFELKRLAEAFSSDRLGIIIFSSEAFVQCPLTYDQRALQLFIETLNTELVPKSGTDFAPPLRMALQKHLDEEETVQKTSKIILLISDGEDFGDEAGSIAEEIKGKGMRLFTLGIGTEAGAKVPSRNGVKRDREGNEVISRLNSDDLQRLAELTDGAYFEVSKGRNDIPRLIRAVSRIEGELRDSRKLDASANKYQYLLYAALSLVLLDILLTVRVLRL